MPVKRAGLDALVAGRCAAGSRAPPARDPAEHWRGRSAREGGRALRPGHRLSPEAGEGVEELELAPPVIVVGVEALDPSASGFQPAASSRRMTARTGVGRATQVKPQASNSGSVP